MALPRRSAPFSRVVSLVEQPASRYLPVANLNGRVFRLDNSTRSNTTSAPRAPLPPYYEARAAPTEEPTMSLRTLSALATAFTMAVAGSVTAAAASTAPAAPRATPGTAAQAGAIGQAGATGLKEV